MPEPAARERQAQLNTEAELLERFDLLKFVCQLREFEWPEQGWNIRAGVNLVTTYVVTQFYLLMTESQFVNEQAHMNNLRVRLSASQRHGCDFLSHVEVLQALKSGVYTCLPYNPTH